MTSDRRWILWSAASIICIALTAGCGADSNLDPATIAIRNSLLAKQTPRPATTIADARIAALESRLAEKVQEVTITGTIDANGHDPWEKESSSFVVMDASEEYLKATASHNHDDGDCPFCKQKSEPNQYMAVIEIVGDDGQIFSRSAQPILGLKQKQTITVRGDAKINELNMLVVTAKQVHVQR